MPLPNPGMDFDPFDPLTAVSLDDLVENIEALADGNGVNDPWSPPGDIRIADSKFVEDSSGNELLKFTKTASAVNEVTVANAATGNPPQISATGGDTNIPLEMKGKGTGPTFINPKVILESATADVTLNSATITDITGATSTFTPEIACYARVWAYADFRAATTANDVFSVILDVDGTDQTPAIFFAVPTSGGRFVMAQQWLIALTAASHTLKLQGSRISGTGSVVIEADSTRMFIELIGDDNVTNS